jgi:tetratricopeptide (TPR) repeat protein
MIKNIIIVIVCFFGVIPFSYAEDTADSINIIEHVEKSLIYSKELQKPKAGDSVVIKRGGWTEDDTDAFEADFSAEQEKKIQATISQTKEDTRAVTLKRKAYDALNIGHIEIAAELYKQILKKDKDNGYALLGLATSYHQLGQYRQAKPIYMRLLNVFPGDEQIIANLLAIVTEETPYEAVYLLSALAEKNPNSPLIQAQTSIAYSNVGKYKKGIKYLRKAIMMDPQNIQYRYNLAVLYDMMEDYTQATIVYKEVLIYARSNDMTAQIPYRQIQDRINILENHI